MLKFLPEEVSEELNFEAPTHKLACKLNLTFKDLMVFATILYLNSLLLKIIDAIFSSPIIINNSSSIISCNNTQYCFSAAHPFLSVAMDPSTRHIILGSADGKVIINYDV